jgi:hypothetical protein
MAVEDRFIGTGWSFPPRFAATGVEVTGGQQNIAESVRAIVTTQLGERVMRPDYGCIIESEIFQPMNASRITMIETVLRRAILLHEPRVDARRIAVTADQATGVLTVELEYEIRGSKSRFSLVLPYEPGAVP